MSEQYRNYKNVANAEWSFGWPATNNEAIQLAAILVIKDSLKQIASNLAGISLKLTDSSERTRYERKIKRLEKKIRALTKITVSTGNQLK